MAVFDPIEDPRLATQARIKELGKDKEAQERDEAASDPELEKHLVDFCMDCVETSTLATADVRKMQAECLNVFYEKTPANYAKKEDWQSRVVLPRPFGTVCFAQSVVRKAFDVEYLSIENEDNQEAVDFWKKFLDTQLGPNYANFASKFSDASEMSFAIGQSPEIIPIWRGKKGLGLEMIPSWNVFRDPDALPREPQSGMYWIHREWLDFYLLKELEAQGRYQNVGDITDYTGTEDAKDQEEIDRRKKVVKDRTRFRKKICDYEYWGTVLDKRAKGILYPNATFTIAGNKLIGKPEVPDFETLRWPGTSFGPLPNLLTFYGRGLLEGIRSLWYFMCSLMCLHNDLMNWIVNPPTEINIEALVESDDVDNYPGKHFLTRGTASGQQAVRPVQYRFVTGEILANEQYADQNFQRGTFVNDAVQGLPGYRKDEPWRSTAQNLEQSLNVFGMMGKNLETGALQVIRAAAETIRAYVSLNDLSTMMPEEEANKYRDPNPESKTGIKLPSLTTGNFHVSGISTMMRNMEVMMSIRDNIIPLTKDPLFSLYMKRWQLLQSLLKRLNLTDEQIVVDKPTADRLDQAVEQAVIAQAAQMALQSPVPPGASGTAPIPGSVPAESPVTTEVPA